MSSGVRLSNIDMVNLISTVGCCFNFVRKEKREYYIVARKYEIYFECEQDISRVSAANE